MMGMPLIQMQFYAKELEHAARQFIRHAQYARQYALYSGHTVVLKPRVASAHPASASWAAGWQVEKIQGTPTQEPDVLVQYVLHRDIRVSAHRFIDPHTGTAQIRFNPAGAAKTKHGGFVANRLILTHAQNQQIQRHIVLAASGRWRICQPNAHGTSC